MRDTTLDPACCYQSVKDKNFESNSQLFSKTIFVALSCYQSVKDKNFESNSQRWNLIPRICGRCYQSVKDKNFESNSQLEDNLTQYFETAITSKLKKQ